MRKWETLAALLAVVLASLSVVKVGGHPRPLLALGAIVLLGLVGFSRLRAAAVARKSAKPLPSAYERALRIQEQRDRKFDR
ncbi:MAG TPA: hypothetical protein VIG51_05690 [Candidatus Baltobacteraceae bacterium]|jgi:hypothetical protein